MDDCPDRAITAKSSNDGAMPPVDHLVKSPLVGLVLVYGDCRHFAFEFQIVIHPTESEIARFQVDLERLNARGVLVLVLVVSPDHGFGENDVPDEDDFFHFSPFFSYM